MKITKNSVVQFHYVLRTEQDELLEDSNAGDPIALLFGHNNVVTGLEKALEGKEAGEQLSVTVSPEEGYGERSDDAIQRIPVKHLQGAIKWKPGMLAVVNTEQGQRQVTVLKVGKFMVTCDTNHPLAGRTLKFDVNILDVREGSTEEISHGHAHGVGGHQH